MNPNFESMPFSTRLAIFSAGVNEESGANFADKLLGIPPQEVSGGLLPSIEISATLATLPLQSHSPAAKFTEVMIRPIKVAQALTVEVPTAGYNFVYGLVNELLVQLLE